MTLRALWTFDHIANPTIITFASGQTAYSAQGAAYNFLTGNPGAFVLRSGTISASIAPSNAAADPGYLRIQNTTAAAQGLAIAPADVPILQGGVTKAYFGFRTVAPTLIPLPNTLSVVGVASGVTIAPTPLLTEAQLNRTVNVSQYVEVMLDVTNNVYSVWVDGLQIINQAALPSSWTYLIFGSNAVNTNNGYQSFRDFYFLDADTTTPNKRLGPIQSSLATLVAATAPNYASSDSKTPLVDLTTAYSGSPTSAPNLSNAPTNDPITATFQSNSPVGATIVGVQYKLAASVAVSGKMQVGLANGQTSVVAANYQFPDTTMVYGRDLAGIQQTDPSGNAWTAARFAATQLALTPQAIT